MGANSDSESAQPKAKETPRTQNAHSTQKAPQSSSLLSGLLGGNLGDIKIDEEKALIGLLIYILYKQGADIKSSSGALVTFFSKASIQEVQA